MKRYAIILSFVLFPFAALAETYPSTLSVEEQERHEFYDVQQESYPGGRVSVPAGGSPKAQIMRPQAPGPGTFVPTPSPWLNDRAVP
ncbi:hypothetical protein [Xanthobacter versatilis]|uniref:hypothetical protein n=1 Tax=Xanthobacter autotrophicus (strain ATCC BAA-1158 / Py2) TaxID=78245 RepID=UPI00372777F4